MELIRPVDKLVDGIIVDGDGAELFRVRHEVKVEIKGYHGFCQVRSVQADLDELESLGKKQQLVVSFGASAVVEEFDPGGAGAGVSARGSQAEMRAAAVFDQTSRGSGFLSHRFKDLDVHRGELAPEFHPLRNVVNASVGVLGGS